MKQQCEAAKLRQQFKKNNSKNYVYALIGNHYKSWSGLKKQLTENLCDTLRGRITFFLTRYHDVHNSYGRASIRLDGKELTNFSWVDMYKQEFDVNEMWKTTGEWDYDNSEFKEK